MKRRLTLAMLALLFFGPVIVAWVWFFYLAEPAEFETVNKGTLVSPVVALADAGSTGELLAQRWSILLLADNACEAACEQALYTTRQVWRRLDRDRERVQRVLLADDGLRIDSSAHPELRQVEPSPEIRRRLVEAVPNFDPASRIYLVDPRGNLMMSYPLDLEPSMLYDDLRRLLRYAPEG